MSTVPAASIPRPDADGLVHGLTVEELKLLSTTCLEARALAYCPYSLFRVGASLLIHASSPTTASTTVISGANVENASYPVGTCAERTALGTAILQGHRLGSFKAIGVATDMDDFCSPCGMCRQFIREFCGNEVPIFMHNKSGEFRVLTVGELLPMSFGPEALPPRDVLKGIVGVEQGGEGGEKIKEA